MHGGNRRAGILVVAGNNTRRQNLAQFENAAQRHHLAIFVLNIELVDAVNIFAELPIGLQHNLVNLSTKVNIVNIAGAEVILQNREDAAYRYPHSLRLLTVNINIDIRSFGSIGCISISNFRSHIYLHEHILQRGFNLLRIVGIGGKQTIIHTAAHAQAHNCRRFKELNLSLRTIRNLSSDTVHDVG